MIYKITKGLLWIYYHLMYRIQVKGTENIPREGAVILCANHIHVLDPFIIGISIPRELAFIAKKEIFKFGIVRWFLLQVGAFPVDRGAADIGALKTALQILKEGRAFGIFAQGTRMKEGEVGDAKSGVALLAMKGKAPVVPIGVSSSYKLFAKIQINIGKPINLDEFKEQRLNSEQLGRITEKIMGEIHNLIG